MLRATLTSSALAALLLLTACDQPADQRAQNGSSQLQPDQSAPGTPAAEPGAMDQTGPTQTAGIPLSDVTDPQKTLANVPVKDNKGDAIGEVKSVSLDTGGKVQAINVGMGNRTVALNASDLTYMQAENTIVAQKSKDEIQNMK